MQVLGLSGIIHVRFGAGEWCNKQQLKKVEESSATVAGIYYISQRKLKTNVKISLQWLYLMHK